MAEKVMPAVNAAIARGQSKQVVNG